MDPLRVYQYSNPGRLVFGPGAVQEIPKEFTSRDKPLIVTDEGVVRAGILERVTGLFARAGTRYDLFDRVVADPPIEVIEEASLFYRESGCTSVIGLGGGSPIDTAKAIALRAGGEGTLREYGSGRPIQGILPPVYAIPTTAGTGSEVSAVAVISDHENKMKVGIKSPLLVPRVAILDPLLLAKIPPGVAAETGADALTHAIETYLSLNSNAITDSLALSAIRMITGNLEKFRANPADVDAAGQMLLASCMAGLSFANAGLGIVHGIAHSFAAYFHTRHGLTCALYLPHVMEFNIPACPDKFVPMAEALGADVRGLSSEEAATRAVGAVRGVFARVGLPKTFSEIGIEFRLHQKMVDDTYAAMVTKANPRKADPQQIAALFGSVA
ncbi:MAG: iron-containing alcohol dehydrogenase [Thermodesulfobacteriota bacterium]